jgi:hypothetical protein
MPVRIGSGPHHWLNDAAIRMYGAAAKLGSSRLPVLRFFPRTQNPSFGFDFPNHVEHI